MPLQEPYDDVALVAQAAAGSEYAFRQLYRAYVRPVYWLAHGLLRDAQDAEDVTQETFLVAWRRLPDLELVGDSLLPWLATVCRFQAANRMRRQRREREHTAPLPDEVPIPLDVARHVAEAETVELILREVGGLSELDRGIFSLCATEGYTYQAAAEALGVPHGVVRNRLSRIRTRLRNVVREST